MTIIEFLILGIIWLTGFNLIGSTYLKYKPKNPAIDALISITLYTLWTFIILYFFLM